MFFFFTFLVVIFLYAHDVQRRTVQTLIPVKLYGKSFLHTPQTLVL